MYCVIVFDNTFIETINYHCMHNTSENVGLEKPLNHQKISV